MEATFIGFGPTTAKAVVFWLQDGVIVSKTVCYCEQDLQDMLDKHHTPGGLYSTFEYEIRFIQVAADVA